MPFHGLALHAVLFFDSLRDMTTIVCERLEAPVQRTPMLLTPFIAALVLIVTLLSGCATTRSEVPEDGRAPAAVESTSANDPLEPVNRAIYTFNEKFDRYIFKPVATGYRAVLPQPVRKGITNFFGNLREPAVMVNNVLQGKFKNAASDLGRFVTNSTLGVLGVFDVATHFGLERNNEDLGQTLAVWGIGDGPFLVLPFLGPSNLRDGIGIYGDQQLYPPIYMEEQSTAWKLYGLEAVDARARLLDAGDILEQATVGQDPYVFVREAYRQRRRSLIKDGEAATPSQLDPSIFEEDAPAEKTGGGGK